MFDFQCDSGHQFEDLVQPEVHEIDCPTCGAKAARLIAAPRLDWRNMGLKPDHFPTAGDRWAKAQTEAKRKEDSVNLKMY